MLTTTAAPAEAATDKACRVRNANSGQTHTRLQAAVNAARRGDELVVRGACAGHTAIGKRLTIVGRRTKRSGGPLLSGSDKIRVLTIAKGATVELRDLVVTRGDSKWGGAIQNNGDLILANVTVRRNRCHFDGIYWGKAGAILNRGRIWLNGASRVQRNYCDSGAGAVWNVTTGTVVVNDSSVIAFNGGVYGTAVINRGTFIMNGSSSIAHNLAGESTGGVSNRGRFVMRGTSTIKRNDCGDPDFCSIGGVRNDTTGKFTMLGRSSVRGSRSTAVATEGTFTMKGASTVTGNSALCKAGGVRVSGGRFVMRASSTVTHNSAVTTEDTSDCELRGAGLYHTGGFLHGVRCGPTAGANVYANSPDDCFFEE